MLVPLFWLKVSLTKFAFHAQRNSELFMVLGDHCPLIIVLVREHVLGLDKFIWVTKR